MNQTLENSSSLSQSQSFGEILSEFSDESEHNFSHEYAELNKMEKIQSSQPNADPHLDSLIKDISQIFPEGYPPHAKERNDGDFADQEKNQADPLNPQSSSNNPPPKRRFSKEELDAETKRFEGLLDQVGLFCKNTEKTYEETRRSTIKMIREKFTDLRFLVNAKEGQFIHEINSFCYKEVEKLQKQAGKNSLVKQGITRKISELRQIIQNGHPCEPLDDLSDGYQIIQEAVGVESLNKISQKLQEMKQHVDSMLGIQISALEKITVENEDLALIQRELDLKLKEKLSSREELKKYHVPLNNSPSQALAVSSRKSDIVTQGGWLKISYPFAGDFGQSLKAIQAAQGNIWSLEFKLLENIDQICQEDLSKLCLMRFKLPKVQNISIDLSDFQVSDDALLRIFSCLFWKNNCLNGISFSHRKGSLEKSVLFLTDTVLPAAKSLKSLSLAFGIGTMTNETHSSLNQRLSQIVGNLTYLYFRDSFSYNENLNVIGLSDLFVEMPNLLSFTFSIFSYEFNDDLLEDFISNTMPSLKNLKEFQLWIPYSKVTDKSIRKLFQSFPEEWFLNLTLLRVNLENTNATNRGLNEFLNITLKKFKALEVFKLWRSTFFGFKEKVVGWEKTLAKESEN